MSGLRRKVWCVSDGCGRVVDGLYGSEADADAALRDYKRWNPREHGEYRVEVVDPHVAQWMMAVDGWDVV